MTRVQTLLGLTCSFFSQNLCASHRRISVSSLISNGIMYLHSFMVSWLTLLFSMCSFTLFTSQENSLFCTLIATVCTNKERCYWEHAFAIRDFRCKPSLLNLNRSTMQALRHSSSGHLQTIIMA